MIKSFASTKSIIAFFIKLKSVKIREAIEVRKIVKILKMQFLVSELQII